MTDYRQSGQHKWLSTDNQGNTNLMTDYSQSEQHT